MALAFAREGAQVTVTYLPEEHSDALNLQKEAAKNPMGPKEIHIIEADLKSRDTCKKVIDEHVKKYGGLEILVNNASMQV